LPSWRHPIPQRIRPNVIIAGVIGLALKYPKDIGDRTVRKSGRA
jgi:hypothetical protein